LWSHVPRVDPAQQRAYQRSHYQTNRARYISRTRARLDGLKQHIAETKVGKPCVDCGVTYPEYVTSYDHRPGEVKIGSVNSLTNIPAIDAEIAKCDLVCANCLRAREHERRG
jgi:hypothetical protein